MKKILEAKNIMKSFGNKDNLSVILDNVSMNLKEGDFTSIMGPSGCGKSTLLYILSGLLKPTEGEIFISGTNIATLKDREMSQLRRGDIGFVFQFYNLVQNLSVEENILLPVVMQGKKSRSYSKELDEILDIVGLQDKRKYVPNQLSGGQQQRVAIARAIITNPRIIFADEPIGNLDQKSGKDIMKLFADINKTKKITILQVTHSEEAALYGNRIIRLLDGKIVHDGEKE
jgi:putative ABC transport system ATP-binding protein